MRVTDVEHVQEQVGVHRFLKRRLEACDEVCGRSRTKPTVSLSSTSVPSSASTRASSCRRREQLVIGVRAGGRQRVEQHALAGVRVADDADREVLALRSLTRRALRSWILAMSPSSAMRPRTRRRSISSCCSPGPACRCRRGRHRRCAPGDPHARQPRVWTTPARTGAWPRACARWRRCRGSARCGRAP